MQDKPIQTLLPLHILTLGGAALAGAAWALPEGWRGLAWGMIGAGYLGVTSWGSFSMASGIMGRTTVRGPADRPVVALTFDDGPDPTSTPALLELLARRGLRATFFCVGERAAAQPALVRRIVAEGHVLGNHGARHAWWTNFLPIARMHAEIARAQDLLRTHAGVAPRFYRPPFGLMNHAVLPACRALGLQAVGWTLRGLDTTGRPPDAVVRRVLARVAPGAIVLLHDGGQPAARVVEITERVLDGFAARSLRAVGLDELLAGRAPAATASDVQRAARQDDAS